MDNGQTDHTEPVITFDQIISENPDSIIQIQSLYVRKAGLIHQRSRRAEAYVKTSSKDSKRNLASQKCRRNQKIDLVDAKIDNSRMQLEITWLRRIISDGLGFEPPMAHLPLEQLEEVADQQSAKLKRGRKRKAEIDRGPKAKKAKIHTPNDDRSTKSIESSESIDIGNGRKKLTTNRGKPKAVPLHCIKNPKSGSTALPTPNDDTVRNPGGSGTNFYDIQLPQLTVGEVVNIIGQDNRGLSIGIDHSINGENSEIGDMDYGILEN